MSDVQVAVTILCAIALVLLVFLAFFHKVDFLSWIQAWIRANKEEKVSLTKLKGHYNANGYLVHSDSDIPLTCSGSGSFRRFETVDGDFRMTTVTTTGAPSVADWTRVVPPSEDNIPPQPLRPAPVPGMVTPPSSGTISGGAGGVSGHHAARRSISCTNGVDHSSRSTSTAPDKTSICPIPRPVSSVNVATLMSQSSFPVCLTPPPSPAAPPPTPAAPTIAAPGPLTAVAPPLKLAGVYVQPKQQVTVPPNPDPPPPPAPDPDADALPSSAALQRAMSCDSICSDTSVALGDLEMFNITGYLCIGLEYDSECWDLIVNVLEAKNLTGITKKNDFLDTYVRVSLLPDIEATIQTKVYRSAGSPSYKERFLFSMNPREQSARLLCFHVYATDFLSHTLVGEGEIRLADVSLRQPVTTWVTLTDTGQRGTEFGEIMFSLSYLPTAERLTVVVVKARNLKFSGDSPGEAFVKVYLMHQNKKINKKKTSTKKGEKSPIFNESMMFSVPAHTLSTIQLRLTVAEPPVATPAGEESSNKAYSIGHVIVGAQATGRSLSHWNQMLTALRKPVAMWHSLRK